MGRPKSERPTGRYKKTPHLGAIWNTSTNQPSCQSKIAAQHNCPVLPDVRAGLSLESIALWACECRSRSALMTLAGSDHGFFSFPATTLLRICCQKPESIIFGTPEEHYHRLIQKSHCGAAVHKTLVFIDAFGWKHIRWLTHKDSFATIMMTPTRLLLQRTMTCPFHLLLNVSEVEFLYGSENSRDFMLCSWDVSFYSSCLRPLCFTLHCVTYPVQYGFGKVW